MSASRHGVMSSNNFFSGIDSTIPQSHIDEEQHGADMRLQSAESTGSALQSQDLMDQKDGHASSSLPFGKDISLASISGPTYLTSQAIVQQVAYALSDKIFAYSPPSFDLDTAVQSWSNAHNKNSYGEVTGVHSCETRDGAGTVALGYMFSPDFDLARRHVPQSILASSGSLSYLQSSLDQLTLLHDMANPTTIQVAAVDYSSDAKTGLVSDYCASLAVAEELGMGLVASKSVHEVQHMSLLSMLMSAIQPSIHTYDGIMVGRETTRVIDTLDVAGLKRTYDATISAVKNDLASKRLTSEGKMSKLVHAFNAELGTEYKCFEYSGHKSATAVLVVFGTVEASLSAQVADALAKQGVRVGVVNVRVYRPFVEDEFLEILPETAEQIIVLGQVKETTDVSDICVSSSLFADVLAAVNFHGLTTGIERGVYEVKYARETVWTVAKMSKLLYQVAGRLNDAPEQLPTVQLSGSELKQYSFWDSDSNKTAEAPTMLAQLLSDDDSLNVTVRSGHDNLVQGGVLRTDLRCSQKSIEAAYSIKEADVTYVGEAKLLEEFNIMNSVKDNSLLILKFLDWKHEDAEKNLSSHLRKDVAEKKLRVLIFDPHTSANVSENPDLEAFLLQLGFLKHARPEIYDFGLQKLRMADDMLERLAKDVDVAIKTLEIPDDWLTAELEENEAIPSLDNLNVNSFAGFQKVEDEPPSYLRDWATAAKGLAFREAYGTSTALRPDLATKTSVVHVKEHRRLTPLTYDRNIFHIEFDLGTSGLQYEIGEALGIHAENNKADVEDFIKWYGLEPEEVVEVPTRDDSNVLENRTVYQALLQNVDIFGRPPKRFYEALSEFATDEKEKQALLALGTGGNQEAVLELKRRAEVDTVTYADILLEFPSAHPSFHEIARIVNPMKRREYSIASSQKVSPNSVSLLIVTVNWVDPKGRDRFGQATRYLNALPVGAAVTVSVKPSVMKLPPTSTQPIIMAGLGTGLAPFRAFVQERAWQKQQGMPIGDVFLYMGSRHQREEYLYGEEWEAYQAAGIITLIGRAFSRDQPQKIYIQDRMRETLNDIRRAYLRNDGAFYLCGPTWPVPDVTNVLEEAVEVEAASEGKKKSGAKEIERLKEELRYVLEVY